ncbi:HAD family hydrolase [Actinomadura flavalba]|uniref:HAD family hydrolase n=1 Tax=Actinomadura flavalba TaxID=1120938 RepID=UPI000370A872|nr:HAD family hydrolase [Actinomadura flavalba]
MQRLALFDLDHTLVNLDEAFGVWAVEFADKRELAHQAVAWLLDLNAEGYPHREVFFGRVRERFGLVELWRRYRRRMPHLARCPSAVINGLALLWDAGWKVGVVTNWTPDNQLGNLQRTGLAAAVNAYALAGIEGVRKPDVRLFEIAAQRCGTTLAGGGWMVGDHPIADISGGHAASLHTVWIDRGTWPGQEHEADQVVTDVLQATQVIQQHHT